MLPANKEGFFPYTPATNLLYGLAEAIDMLHEEGLDRVFARHDRHAEGVRRAVAAWGLEILVQGPEVLFAPSLTAVLMPEGHNADAFRKIALEHFDVSLGTGLTKVAGKVFRIGHLGDTNDLTMIGTLAGVEMGLGARRRAAQAGRRARRHGLLRQHGQGRHGVMSTSERQGHAHHRRQPRHRRGHRAAGRRSAATTSPSTTPPTRRRPRRSSPTCARPAARPSPSRPTSRKPDDIARLFKTVDAELGRLDAFFNNAGIVEKAAKFVDIAPERLQRILAVNTIGAFIAAQEAVRRMSTRLGGKGGVIVNMSSMAAKLGGSNESTDYATAKGAIDSLTIGLAKELAPEGIRVNAVRPGLIDTDIQRDFGVGDRVGRNKGLVPHAARRHGRGGGRGRAVAVLGRGPPTAPASSSTSPAAAGSDPSSRHHAVTSSRASLPIAGAACESG